MLHSTGASVLAPLTYVVARAILSLFLDKHIVSFFDSPKRGNRTLLCVIVLIGAILLTWFPVHVYVRGSIPTDPIRAILNLIFLAVYAVAAIVCFVYSIVTALAPVLDRLTADNSRGG
jgi:hypothetical protein